MLLTFYPDVSAAAFARARRERPEYFSGGTIVGSHGDKLRLPDSHIWDCIFDVENATGQRHWQCIDVSDGGGTGDPVFALEPGPLTPIDETQWPKPTPQPVFLPIVVDALDGLAGSDTVLGSAASTIAEASSGAAFDAAVSGAIDDGDGQRGAQLGAALGATPDDVLDSTTGSGGTIAGGEGDAEFAAPPYVAPTSPGAHPDDRPPGGGDHPTPNPD
jgi:hypothetical protein